MMNNMNNFAYQSSMNSNQGFYNGGYPIGYPPMMSKNREYGYNSYQMEFIPPPYIPGVSSPLEHTDRYGNTTVIKSPATGYNPGGATLTPGGFNPVTNSVTPSSGIQGYAPQKRFIGNPAYSFTPKPIDHNREHGYEPYSPDLNSWRYQNAGNMYTTDPRPFYNNYNTGMSTPYMSPITGCMGYSQNQFDYALQEFLYNENPSVVDTRSMLESIILTDEEREKVERRRSCCYGYDYYGNPIYGGSFQSSQTRQNQFEEARRNYQNHFTMLSRIAHACIGEEINEEETMKRWDPVPPPPEIKMFNYFTATDEEKKEYEREARFQSTQNLVQQLEYAKIINNQIQMQKEAAFRKIKESHDRLIGVEPGEHYDLKTYLDNGYKLNVDLMMQKAKSANRNGTSKYSRNDFRAGLSEASNRSVPITSKDDEYISIEQMLKGVYDRNKNVDSILRSENGQTTYTSLPAFGSEYEAHQYFLNYIQDKKNVDDVRRAIR